MTDAVADIRLRENGLLRRAHRGSAPAATTLDEAWLPGPVYDRLEQWDDREGRGLFRWGSGRASVGSWVGVVQVPGARITLLPKITGPCDCGSGTVSRLERNLMHMLTVARMVPCRSLDASSLTTLRGPLLESFVQLFAETLRTELLRGLPHAYLRYEEDLRVLRGRLDAGRQITQLAAHRDRFACRYDVFTPDTGLNRVLKAACRYVLPALRTVGAQEAVATCISLLDDVRDVGDPLAAARHVLIDRQTERLRESFDFACLLLEQQRPGLSGGQTRAISLVFDMPHLFEAYVGQVLAREAPRRLRGFRVGLQGRGHRRFLCESGGRGILQLQPDIVVDRGDDLVVVDTKWKCSREGTFGRWVPAREDLFQMHAYQHRYGAAHGVLLYPETGEAVHQEFRMVAADGSPGVPLLVRFVPLHEELWHGVGRQTVVDAVCQAVAGRMRGAEVELETAAP